MSETVSVQVSSWRDRFAAGLRGWGPLGIIGFLFVAAGTAVIVPLGALVILLWVWLSKTPWRDVGYVRPRNWAGAILIGVAFGVALKLAMKAIVMPLMGAPAVNAVYHYMAGNPSAVATFAAYAVIGAGWGEETVFRGYLFERLGRIFGSGAGSKALIVVLTAALFGVAHFDQSLAGMTQALIVGFTFGAIFAITGRLVMLMIAHAAFDLTAAVIIYLDAETRIAHLVFP